MQDARWQVSQGYAKLNITMVDSRKAADGRPFLRRLARDTGGNTLAIMAMSLVPVSALAGSAVDTARMYAVKVRLQQACDAGVLAGRKFMDGDGTALNDTAVTQANRFFSNNFRTGWMQISNPTFTPTKTGESQVAGTASAVVPMTVMKMFGAADVTLNVQCEARYDVPDVDIVFVLDTTGSMACTPEMSDTECGNYGGTVLTYTRPADSGGVPNYAGTTGYYTTEKTDASGKNVSRIQALRSAVEKFHKTMSDNIDSSTNVRYGFVTYSSMVNPGQAILDKSSAYMLGGAGSGGVTSWTYQSRTLTGDYTISTDAVVWNNKTQANCTAAPVRVPAATSTQPYTYSTPSATAKVTTQSWQKNGKTDQCGDITKTVGPVWKYQPVSYDVSRFVAGDTVANPARVDGTTAKWAGCIEERQTDTGQLTFNTSALPADLDPDLIPNSDNTRWKPLWPEVEYLRSTWNNYPSTNGESTSNQSYSDPARLKLGKMACGKPIQRLRTMDATDVHNFVYAADFKASGGTYHDIGMIWGVRLLSTKGIFASDTAAWSGHNAPKRVIIFLTDGDMAPSADAYSVYGVEQLDRRVTNGNTNDRIAYHNARFLAECAKAQSMNIDVWTVSIAPSANAQLTQCAANSAQALFTTDGDGLSDAFKKIAERVAMLRLSK